MGGVENCVWNHQKNHRHFERFEYALTKKELEQLVKIEHGCLYRNLLTKKKGKIWKAVFYQKLRKVRTWKWMEGHDIPGGFPPHRSLGWNTQATFENTGWRPNSIAVTGLKVETLRFFKNQGSNSSGFIDLCHVNICLYISYMYKWYVYRCVYIYTFICIHDMYIINVYMYIYIYMYIHCHLLGVLLLGLEFWDIVQVLM